MSDVVKRNPMSPLTELFDWFNSGWPSIADWPHDGARALRIEDRLEQDRYVVRAEIPGVDPDKDVEIMVDDGVLTISAERREEVKGKERSELHYGSFLRRVSLHPGSKEEQSEDHTLRHPSPEPAGPLPPHARRHRTAPQLGATADYLKLDMADKLVEHHL